MSEIQPTVTYKPVPGFPGYRVGDDGTVWSAWQKRRRPTGYGAYSVLGQSWRMLKAYPAKRHGRVTHCRVVLMRDGQRHDRNVHSLVLEAFVGPCPEGMEGCHGDGDATNNRLLNLRWDTRTANSRDSIRHGTRPRGGSHGNAKLTETQVRAIRAEYAAGGVTYADLARKYGLSNSVPRHIVNRLSWSHVT